MPPFLFGMGAKFEKFKKKRLRELQAWGVLVYLLVFVACAAAIGDALGDFDHAPGQVKFLFGAVLVFFAWTFIIAAHEIGHASVAWLVGWRVPVIAIRKFTFWPKQGRLKYGLPAFPGFGGAVLVVPRKETQLRWSLAAIMAGGSLSNFVLAVVAALAAIRIQDNLLMYRCCNVLAILSGMTGFLNLLPFRKNNDGWHLSWILRGVDCRPYVHLLQLFEEVTKGIRPREWAVALVEQVQADFATNASQGGQGLLLFCWHFDRRDMNAAFAALDGATVRLGESNPGLLISRALFLAYAYGDGVTARALLSSIKNKILKNTPGYWVARTAVEWATGDEVARESADRQARYMLKQAPFADVSDIELLDEMKVPRSEVTCHNGGRQTAP